MWMQAMCVLYWMAGTAVLLQLLAFHCSASHVCIHDKIALEHLPTIQTRVGGHEKRSATGFSPIRITPHFIEPLSSTFRSQLTSEAGALMKVLSLINRTLLVRRISGNMMIPPTCDEYAYGPNKGKCKILHTITQCGPYIVPHQYLGTRQVCTSPYGTCHDIGRSGTGAANTDFLLFVAAQSYCFSSNILAFASSCAIDQWHRPSAGYLTLCPSNLIASTNAENIPEVLFNLILHEISHALGFSKTQLKNFHDGSLNFYRPDTTGYYNRSTITAINSPKVLQVARNYFGCRDLPFVPLENNGGRGSASSHWEARVLHHETMAPFLSNDYAVFSNFTLAFFEDSGWYQVNYTFINNYDQFELQWGRGLGCEFVLESCNNPKTYPYLCDTAVLHQCTFDHMAKGSCISNHIFFDGCPVVIADDDSACIHRINTPVPNYKSEVYGEGSICVEVNSTLGDCLPMGGTPRCYQRRVVQQTSTDQIAFSININGSTYWCRDSEVLNTSNGFVFCPSRDEILLRVSEEDISPVQTLPVPANVVINASTIGIFTNSSAVKVCSAPIQQACIHGDIRLVDGSTPYEGRVEVCRNDEWGTICDDGWGISDARVVCRQLGFETRGARAYYYAYFGQGTGVIHLTYVGCTGTESRLLSCRYSTPYRYSCSHYEDAGVRCMGPCQHGSLHVINRYGTISRKGNVELCINGRWRAICANSWDNRDASVVCRQIGYSPFGAVSLQNIYPSSNHRFVNTEVNCTGLESNITDCIQNLDEAYSCLSFDIASVSCYTGILPNVSCTDGAVRLRNGYLPGEGRVEICINNAWGTVCDDGWDNIDASVVCRQLGYYSVGKISRITFGQGVGPIFMEYVHCSGFEESLLDCDHNGLGLSTCGHWEDAGVVCQVNPLVDLTANCTLRDVRLVNGTSELEGRVEVCFGNLWGTICHNSWDNRDAGVICKLLFNSSFGGHAINGSSFGSGDNPIVIQNINCNGTEHSLTDCSTFNSTTSPCNDSTVAGIVCYAFQEEVNITCSTGAIRLADGLTEYEGRVEICYDNHWGGVCGNSWGINETTVVCRQLGHVSVGATALTKSYFGVGFRHQFMQVTLCLGTEHSLMFCTHTPLGSDPSCNALNEVGVRCIVPSNACTPGDVRLFGGANKYQGTVEVCFYGVWGTVCDLSYYWIPTSNTIATVVCKQLGFSSLGAIYHRYAYYGRGTGPIFMSNVYCRGWETHFTRCSHSTSTHYCTHYRDIGVECPVPSNDTCTSTGDLRLAESTNWYQGRVEVCYNGQWGTVCDDSWGTSDARVACRQLGFSGIGATAYSNAYFGRGTGGIYLDNIGCRGSESRLIDCYHSVIGFHNCDHSDDAGIRCRSHGTDCTHGQIHLRGGSTSRSGRVEICVDGTWGTVCDDGWSYNDARVACRQLGFPTIGAVVKTHAYYGRGSGYIMLTYVGCTGEERNLLSCTHTGYGVTSCSHSEDAGVSCPAPILKPVNCANGDLRLRGGLTSQQGRVEMCYEGQWGTVCDDYWGTNDAKVACRQLGFSSFGATYYTNAYFGRGTGPILLGNVGCTGRESRLLDCYSSGVGVYSSNCGHWDDAGVRCKARGNECGDGAVRLRGGTRVGRVEICTEGRWGGICSHNWDSRDAAVVCRQLGYSSLGPVAIVNYHYYYLSFYGSGLHPIWLDHLSCTGMETSLLNCSHSGIGITNSCSNFVGVKCPALVNGDCTTGALRLVGGTTANEGRVEICYDNQWGTVCDDLWSITDARVVCRQLGYSPLGAIAYTTAYFGRGNGGIFLDNVGCTGTESTLLNCYNPGIGYHNCRHSEDAGVRCLVPTNCTEGQIRLRGGQRQGTVEICLSGFWGTICDNSWDSRDASVVCRQLGYPVLGAIPLTNAYYGSGTGPVLIDYVSCMGNEQFLANCTNRGIGVTSSWCAHYNDAGVQCPAPVNAMVSCTSGGVRLVDGFSSYDGRVEICYNNQWGTVCDNSFTNIDARVVCRQLGHVAIGATAYSNAHFGRGSGGIFLDYVGCRGTESSLLSCSHRGIGVHSCQHGEDVGVRCSVPSNCFDGQIRLKGGLTQREGRVEICFGKVWGTICDTQWDYREAQVACRQLGYTPLGAVAIVNAHFGSGTGSLLLNILGCTGTEANLLSCYHRGIGVVGSNCTHSGVVGVRCQVPENCTNGELRLRGGTTPREGRVEICINKIWGTICGTLWDNHDAQVVCRQLGFPSIGAESFHGYFGYGAGSLLLDWLGCTGREQTLLNCSHSGIGGVTSYYCGYHNDAGVRCLAPFIPDNCTEGTVRLFGSTTTTGTVQVCVNRTWGSVCDRSWDSQDATVTCRQLGFPAIGAIPRFNAYYGRTTGPIWLDYLSCTGNENTVFSCTHNGINSISSFCDHGDDAGVDCPVPVTSSSCNNGSLRLVGGQNLREGRVEVCYNNQWGTVCNNYWGFLDADVVCKQLGFSCGLTTYVFTGGTGGIFLDNVHCTGRESRLVDCTHNGIGVHNCDHSADAGVKCLARNCFVEGDIHLRDGSLSREGRVEICLNGVWGTVCDDGWSNTDARVVCRQLGYPTIGAQAYSNAFFGHGTGPILMAYVGCHGEETHLANCSHSTPSCFHSEDAGVRCPEHTGTRENCTDGDLRLRGGTTFREGRLEICYERQWGTVCDNNWEAQDAQVACRQLGFSSYGATTNTSAYYGRGTGLILLDDVGCTGTESRLLDCHSAGVGVSNCDLSGHAGVSCQIFDGCPSGTDSRWNITWANTEQNATDTQHCPGGAKIKGNATRLCTMNGIWADPDVLECNSQQFLEILSQAEDIFTTNRTAVEILEQSASLTTQLTVATETSGFSLLPSELNTTNTILSKVINVLESSVSMDIAPANEAIVDVLSNTLEETNLNGWKDLQEVSPGSQVLLDNAERYGLYLARSLNNINPTQVLSRKNIVISAKQFDAATVDVSSLDNEVFPMEEDLVNYTQQVIPALISIPPEVLLELSRSDSEVSGKVPIAHVLFQNLDDFLPTAVDGQNNSQDVSAVLSSQVGNRHTAAAVSMDTLMMNPISLTFNFISLNETSEFRCAYWNFSEPVGNGSWVTDDITINNSMTDGNVTSVQCLSTHLTSFAVLVDVAGGLQEIPEEERKALQIVSYIGCAISTICLVISVVFFALQGKKLFQAVHMFVHLNLAISLLLGYLIFMLGIETAISSSGGCAFVATLLHYFFLAAFCWMLCEGVMLYLMLVVVFSKLSKRWWFFLILGWVTPIPIVVTALASRHQQYGVRDENGNLIFCWISVEKGTVFAFVVPVLVIILINVVFLFFAVRSLLKSKKRHWSTQQMKKKAKIITLVKATLKATVILLPLLGLTWLFGILAIDRNTSAMAWLFTICNSTQGVVILFFHVVRNEKVWSKVGPRFTIIRQKTLSSNFWTQKYEVFSSSGIFSTLKGGTIRAKREKKSESDADCEMKTLSKQSGTSEGSKFTSLVHSEPDPEVSKVPLDEGKAMEIISSADGSQEIFKAMKTEISMAGSHYPEKEMDP